MTDITTEEKIEYIEQTRSFGEIRQAWFPPSASTEYYFVSYCHSDYKAVFRDLFGMQAVDPEFSVWYDRELAAGKDWKAEARKHICDFNCKGVIFYVSGNSVRSKAVLEEMQMTRDARKAFLPIMLPTGERYMSGAELFGKVVGCGGAMSAKAQYAATQYAEMFGKDITYLKLSDEPEYKVDAIRKSLRGEPLLRISEGEFLFEKAIDVSACNNIDVTEIGMHDFVPEDDALRSIDNIKISVCAFANCANLRQIELPLKVKCIGAYAFLNCKSLKYIVLPPSLRLIGESAFSKCYGLTDAIMSVEHVSEYAFEGCKSLKRIKLKKKISGIDDGAFWGCEELENFDFTVLGGRSFYSLGLYAFYDCKRLKSALLPSGLERIHESTFEGCSQLSEVELPQTLKEIDVRAFYDCHSLKSIRLPKSIETILSGAFADTALTDIYYDGTVEEWYRVFCDDGWDDGTPDYTVHCADGDVKKIKLDPRLKSQHEE